MAQIVIMKLSEVENLRIEAEFNVLSKKYSFSGKYKGINIISQIQYGTSDELNEENRGYPILRLNEFDGLFIDKPAKYCDSINKEEFEDLRLKKGDVLICRTNGNPQFVGKSAIVMEDTEYAYASYLFKVRTKKDILNPHTLMIFLNTPYGRNEINKYSMTSNQTNFSPAKFREINIPSFSEALQKKVKGLVEKSFELKCNSLKLYANAEQILLKDLNLKDYESEHKLSFQASIIEIIRTKRFDADYYQPKYKKIEKMIKDGNYLKLKEIFSIIKGVEVGSEAYQCEGIPFLRVSNLNKLDFNWSNPEFISEGLHGSLKNSFNPKVGEILLSKDATPGMAYLVRDNIKTINSGGILRLVKKNIIPHNQYLNLSFLTLVLNSIVVQQQMKRDSGGAIIVHWRPDEIRETLIPILPKDTQDKIAEKLEESYKLRKESKELLEKAKKMVEDEIEKEAKK